MPSATSIRWVFTLNNYTEEQVSEIGKWDVRYLIFGREVGVQGTPHLQGFVIFNHSYRLTGVRKLLNTAHWEIAKGTSLEASIYCKKESSFTEYGILPNPKPGNPMEAIKTLIDNGATFDEIEGEHFGTCMRYGNAIHRYINKKRNTPKLPKEHPLRPWQTTLYSSLKRAADDRTVQFIVDREGNQGKTWLATYFEMHFPLTTQIMKPGKKVDLAFELNPEIRTFFLDCTRVQTERIQYDFLEELKDGRVHSGKYESLTKHLKGNCHVVVLMNEMPDESCMSRDRYLITELN